jgi:hypothetical protein
MQIVDKIETKDFLDEDRRLFFTYDFMKRSSASTCGTITDDPERSHQQYEKLSSVKNDVSIIKNCGTSSNGLIGF